MEVLVGCGSSLSADAGNCFLVQIQKHICYLYNYKNNMKGLEDVGKELVAKRSDAIRLVDDANTQLRLAGSVVTHWQGEADTLNEKAQTIITEYHRRSSCLNPWSRYSSSRKAWKLTQEIKEKIDKAKDFGSSFERRDIQHTYNLAHVMDFESRASVLNELLEALKDKNVSMCSICGIGGVGKTTLAMKFIELIEPLSLFDKVAMVTVSQNWNFEKIQTEIIELLGLKIVESSMPARANKLNDWLSNNRTLLILDDVWRKLEVGDFDAIGIPLASKGCKIVVTSREKDECTKMGIKLNFVVGVLGAGEAWDMFKKISGECTEDLNLHKIGRNIAAQCGGLPIAIVTIATALQGKPTATWRESLRQLKKSNLSTKISDIDKVYLRIKLSYDLLDNKEAQACFRLCCLYPEDYNIPIEDLVLYGYSLDLFEDVPTMEEARDRVEGIIYKLKTSFLLLDGEKYESVKMHDIIRDFAVSFSSKAEDPYLIQCDNIVRTEWPEITDKYKNCSAISIMCQKMQRHPVDLECPNLELLQLAFGKDTEPLYAGPFGRMEELKALSLKVPALLEPLTVPKKIRALLVTETKLYPWRSKPKQAIGALLGKHLMNLELFSLSAHRYEDFPEEIGFMCNLRFLRLSDMGFRYIPPGVLPKLVKLAELYLNWGFLDWGCTDSSGSRMNASIDEIGSLPLTALEIGVPHGSVLAENMVNNLTRFQIHVGTGYCNDFLQRDISSKTMVHVYEVDGRDITASWLSALLRKSENLSFVQVRDLKNNGFEQSKKIRICDCKEMEYFVDRSDQQIPSTSFPQLEILELRWLDNLKEISHNFSKIEAPLLFRNLIEVGIYRCGMLKSLFPFSVARGLSQLQRMNIHECYEMEKVFYTDEVDHHNHQMQEGAVATSTLNPTIDTNNISINHEKPDLICPPLNSITCGLLGRGKQPKSVPNQQQMEENSAKRDEKSAIIFPQLKLLEIRRMGKLRVFYDGNHAIKLPSLESLSIEECDRMEAFSYGSCATPILQQILINRISIPLGEEDVNAFLKNKMDTRNNIEEEENDNDNDDEIHEVTN